jgi:hypothetical protein
MRTWVSAGCLALAAACWGDEPVGARPPPSLTVSLRDGAVWTVHAVELQGDVLVAVQYDAGGFVTWRAPKEGVREVAFPVDDGLAAWAVAAVDPADAPASGAVHAAALARLAVAPVLSRADAEFCAVYVEWLLASQRFEEAAVLSARLELGPEPARASSVRLESLFRLRDPRARDVARAWCEARDPVEGEALGWWVLAELELATGRSEEALWLALQPIVFGREPLPAGSEPAWIGCVAAAAEAYRRLGLLDQARALREDLRRRGLDWPEDLHPVARTWSDGLAAPDGVAALDEDPVAPSPAAPVQPGRLLGRRPGETPSQP